MLNSLRYLFIPLGLSMLLFAGCSDDEAAKEIQVETKKAAESAKETTKKAADKVKQETPGIIQNMKDIYNEGEKEIKDNTLQKGDEAKIKKDAYLAISPEAYDELYQLIEINDLDGVEKIENEHQIIKVKEGSEVEILERDIRRSKVIIKDTGEEGYFPTTLMDPIN